jgi:hypothetical protein
MVKKSEALINPVKGVTNVTAKYKRISVSGINAVIQSGDRTYVHLWLTREQNNAPVFSLRLDFDTGTFSTNDHVSRSMFDEFVKTLDAKAIKKAVWHVVSE